MTTIDVHETEGGYFFAEAVDHITGPLGVHGRTFQEAVVNLTNVLERIDRSTKLTTNDTN